MSSNVGVTEVAGGMGKVGEVGCRTMGAGRRAGVGVGGGSNVGFVKEGNGGSHTGARLNETGDGSGAEESCVQMYGSNCTALTALTVRL